MISICLLVICALTLRFFSVSMPNEASASLPATPLSVTSPPSPSTHPYKIFINFGLVRKIDCATTEGRMRIGTAVIIDKNVMMTAAHVVSPLCWDDETNLPLSVYYVDRERDFALLAIPATSPARLTMKYSCEGYKPNEAYSSLGYPMGKSLVMSHLTATADVTPDDFRVQKSIDPKLRILNGDIIEGMSGGPIIDSEGTVIGINSVTDHNGTAYSRDLKDTILCDPARTNVPPVKF